MSELIQVCEEAARAGGTVLLEWVGKFSARLKAPRDFVSEADLASQEKIESIITQHFPEHVFIGEEDQVEGNKAAQTAGQIHWIVDPLDGTANYVRGIPHYAVSIGVEQDGKLLAGVVLDPVLDECYTATLGGGTFLNGKPIRTSGITELDKAMLSASFPPKVTQDLPAIKEFEAFLSQCQAVRRGGSAALNLAYVAAGRYDGYWAADLHPWDAAAGALLVKEAGGSIVGLTQEAFDPWNPKLIASASVELKVAMQSIIQRT